MPANPADSSRLTKKQKKASAFRDRKANPKSKSKPAKDADDGAGDDFLPFPAPEPQDVAPGTLDEEQGAQIHTGKTKEGRGRARVGAVGRKREGEREKKRKRDDNEGEDRAGAAEGDAKGKGNAGGQKSRKRARADEAGGAVGAKGDEGHKAKLDVGVSDQADGEEVKGKGKEKQQRLILFVGNLKYTTTKEEIQKHFAECDPPPTVRLLTPKQTRPGAPSNKSKGCAFLEFSARPAVQQALKLHQSEIDGRRINVELTAGGGGRSETRLTKLKTRNKELSEQRMKRAQKEGAAAGGEQPLPERPQRFSTTSGQGDVPPTKRTWTVGDVDDGGTHRGGKNLKKKVRGARVKPWGTGVNAIPVG